MAEGNHRWGRYVQAGLAWLYPDVCQLCENEPATAREGYVGQACRRQVKTIQAPFCERCGLPHAGEIKAEYLCGNCADMELYFSSARSALVAKSVVLEVIHRFKYNGALWFQPFLTEHLIQAAQPCLQKAGFDAIIPIPLHALKLREREYNQAERLAKPLSQALGIPLKTNILRRKNPTQTQTRLSREERALNMDNAFEVIDTAKAKNGRFILIDDVFTTGATSNAAAKALKAANAQEVCVWTVARGL